MRYMEVLEYWVSEVTALCLACRKNHGRQLESLQQSLEEESKAKNEQIRLKKVVEGQIDELQAIIDAGEKVRGEGGGMWGGRRYVGGRRLGEGGGM